jgi:hypothetical protein
MPGANERGGIQVRAGGLDETRARLRQIRPGDSQDPSTGERRRIDDVQGGPAGGGNRDRLERLRRTRRLACRAIGPILEIGVS